MFSPVISSSTWIDESRQPLGRRLVGEAVEVVERDVERAGGQQAGLELVVDAIGAVVGVEGYADA
jgi:hypothetical protein